MVLGAVPEVEGHVEAAEEDSEEEVGIQELLVVEEEGEAALGEDEEGPSLTAPE